MPRLVPNIKNSPKVPHPNQPPVKIKWRPPQHDKPSTK
jgi:hypothetical protein